MTNETPSKIKKHDFKTSLIVFGYNKSREIIIEESIVKQPEVIQIETDCVDDSVSGMDHTMMLLCNGRVICIGDNSQLQFGKKEIKSNFEKLSGLKGFKILGISCGLYHCIAITRDGKLYSWGANDKGQLGRVKSYDPCGIEIVDTLSIHKVIQVACGKGHCIALTNQSMLFSWGDNQYGQLGLGELKLTDTHNPKFIASLECLPIHRIACGENFSLCISTSGSVFTWGSNVYGQLGIGQSSTERQHAFHPILLRSIKDIPICFAACGLNHTALLTLDGGVFTFGEGKYGQLGYSCFDYQSSPRKVPELMGNTIIQISCGANFTLALVKGTLQIYGFGQSDKGQLGMLKEMIEVPVLIRKQSRSYEEYSKKIRKICSGGNHTVIILTDLKYTKGDDFRKQGSTDLSQILYFTEYFYKQILHDKINEEQKVRVFSVFSSLACIAASFRDYSEKNSHFRKTKFKSGLNIEMCIQFLKLLEDKLSSDELLMLRIHLYENILLHYRYQRNYPAIECLRALLFLLLIPSNLFVGTECYEQIHVPIYDCIGSLNEVPKSIIEAWLASLLPRYFKKIVETAVNLVKHFVSLMPAGKTNEIPNKHQTFMAICLEFLKICYTINERSKLISYSTFYVNNLNDKIDIERNFIEWATSLNGISTPFSFCSYPFIFDGRAKTHLLHVEASLFMRNAVLETHTNMLMSILEAHQRERNQTGSQSISNTGTIRDASNQGLNQTISIELENPFFVIKVNRETILEDTLKLLKKVDNKEFKKPLKIAFSNEEAVDDGGVIKEFFLLVIREIMLPKQGLFKCYTESNKCYFQQNVKDKDDVYRCVGQLCGLAIYNGVIVDLHFPLALFKKLLDDTTLPDIDDLMELDPVIGRSLQQIIDYADDDFVEVFEITQEVTWTDINDKMHKADLVSNGSHVTVTKDTKEQYVMDYIQFILTDNVASSFEAFKTGFFLVAVGSVIRLFKPIELQEMIVGTEITDWIELQRLTQYEGEYHQGHKVIKWFWEIFHKDLSENQKKKFLRFLTGCDRAPITAIENFKIVIQPTNGGDKYFPVAHTCFNLLDLPKYSSRANLKSKLLVSIENTEGFGLV